MSNVIKLAGAKGTKKDQLLPWKGMLDEQGDKLFGRLYDQIRLTDEEAAENNIPDGFSDCSILAVLSRLLVTFSASRNVLSPSALVTFVKYQIDLEKKMLQEEQEEKE